jgi:hypothetical protein
VGDERRLSVRECWARLQQIDEALADLPADKGCMHRMGRLLENRQFFERQLENKLQRESPYREILEQRSKDMNNKEQNVHEEYGDGIGKSGNGTQQRDVADQSLRYQNRFEPDRKPRGHNMGDTDEVRG